MSVAGYTELRELGRGAGGRVVAARHDATGVPVAIKHLADELREDPAFVHAYRVEARLMTELADQHIAQLYEYVEDASAIAIVMEYVDGPALSALLSQGGALTPEAAFVVLHGSLTALAAAHERGVVHRDYKPGNVLVSRAGESKLADFGIAARSGAVGLMSGSPSYMAPEQWQGEPAGPPSDIYAATATFVECLTGRPPFVADDLDALGRQHRNAPIPLATVPEPAKALVRDGLAKDAAQRPPTAREFLSRLERAAVAGYGEDWAEHGKAHLAARVAALLALLPLGMGELAGIDLARTRLARIGVVGGAALLALIAGSGAAALTPVGHRTSLHAAGSPGGSLVSTPAATPSIPSATPSRSRSGTPRRTVGGSTSAAPATTTPVSGPTAVVPTVLPPPVSTSRSIAPPPPPVSTSVSAPTTVQKLEILSFNWAKKPPQAVADFYVATSGTAPVHMTIEYTNGLGFDRSAAITTLSGATTYYPSDSEDFTGICGIIQVTVKTDAGGFASASLPSAQC